jgi:hypothetical protein
VSPGTNGRHLWVSEYDIRPIDDPERFHCIQCGAGPDEPIHYTELEEELLEAGAPLTTSSRDFLIFKAARRLELAGAPVGTLEEWEHALRIVVGLVEQLREGGHHG